jgi:hypothetical protein
LVVPFLQKDEKELKYVTGSGQKGRNQELAVLSLSFMCEFLI